MAQLSLRRRLLLLTSSVAVVFAVATGVLLRIAVRPAKGYTPGGEVEGLTATLARVLPDDYPRITFADVTTSAGIQFEHFPASRTAQLPEDMGSGVAWGDYDADGWPDLAIANITGPFDPEREPLPGALVLYRNRGDGTFEDVTHKVGIDVAGWGMAVEWADVDGDGDLDLAHSGYGQLTLYRNRGDGTFVNDTRRSGLAALDGFWAGMGFADYDRDGDLDLYVTGYVEYTADVLGATSQHYDVEEPASTNPSSFRPIANLLLQNRGDGTFNDVAVPSGVSDPNGRSLEVAWVDFDADGWPDIYVANDVSDNRLFRNLGNGLFEDISHVARVSDYRGAMGIAVGDWEGDGDLDMVVTHWIAQENALYSNRLRQSAEQAQDSPLQFMDEADRFGLGQIALDYVGWGTSFFDYDNDGKLDLLVVNGSTLQQRDDPTQLRPMQDLLFWNRGPDEGFYPVSSVAGDYFASAYVGRGAALADFDRDGDLDVFIVAHGGAGRLLANQASSDNAWLQVALRGTASNRFGVGARIRVVASGRTQIREVGAQSSYLSQNELVEHFGLAAAMTVDTVEVRWPAGTVDVHVAVTPRQLVTLVEGRHP